MPTLGKVYLIPVPIADDAVHALPVQISGIIDNVQHYFVENTRTARRFIRLINKTVAIEPLIFSEIDKHTGPDIRLFSQYLKEGVDIGIMSESGCPGVADPGSLLVAEAHKLGADVIPVSGPSSLLLSLMASGLNGQSFCFTGYLPVKDPQRSQRIKQLETISRKENQTQLFIETPYRNNVLVEDLVKTCNDETKLCIAQDITGAKEWIRTQTISYWKKNKPNLEKAPAVFLLLA